MLLLVLPNPSMRDIGRHGEATTEIHARVSASRSRRESRICSLAIIVWSLGPRDRAGSKVRLQPQGRSRPARIHALGRA